MLALVCIFGIFVGVGLYKFNLSWITSRSRYPGPWRFGVLAGIAIVAYSAGLLLDNLQDHMGSPPMIVQGGVTLFFLMQALREWRNTRAHPAQPVMLRDAHQEAQGYWARFGAYLSMALCIMISGFF